MTDPSLPLPCRRYIRRLSFPLGRCQQLQPRPTAAIAPNHRYEPPPHRAGVCSNLASARPGRLPALRLDVPPERSADIWRAQDPPVPPRLQGPTATSDLHHGAICIQVREAPDKVCGDRLQRLHTREPRRSAGPGCCRRRLFTGASGRLLMLIFVAIVLLHWLACTFVWAGALQGELRAGLCRRLARHSSGLELPPPWTGFSDGTWIARAGLAEAESWRIYVFALLKAVTQCFTCGTCSPTLQPVALRVANPHPKVQVLVCRSRC